MKTRERVVNYSVFQVSHFNIEKFLAGHHQAQLSSLQHSPLLQVQDFVTDLRVGREGEGAEVRLQQCSFTRLFMGIPVPARRKQPDHIALPQKEGDVWRNISAHHKD